MIKLNGKIMEERLKHGWTTQFFAEHYETTEQEFLETLEKVFSSKAYKGMLARLKKNEKILHAKHQTSQSLPDASLNEVNQQLETGTASLEEKTDNTKNSSKELLEFLQSKKEELENVLNNLELEHKSITSERAQIRNSISNYKTILLDIQSKIRQYQEELKSLVSELDEKFASMQKINLSISETKVALSEVNEKIDALKKVSIFVYNSGELGIESQMAIEFPEWSHLFDKIVKDELADSLTIKQIKGIAKCLALVQYLKSQNFKYEIAFDDTDTEVYFEKILQEE